MSATAPNDLIESQCGKILHQGATKKKSHTPGQPETVDNYGAVFSNTGFTPTHYCMRCYARMQLLCLLTVQWADIVPPTATTITIVIPLF